MSVASDTLEATLRIEAKLGVLVAQADAHAKLDDERFAAVHRTVALFAGIAGAATAILSALIVMT